MPSERARLLAGALKFCDCHLGVLSDRLQVLHESRYLLLLQTYSYSGTEKFGLHPETMSNLILQSTRARTLLAGCRIGQPRAPADEPLQSIRESNALTLGKIQL